MPNQIPFIVIVTADEPEGWGDCKENKSCWGKQLEELLSSTAANLQGALATILDVTASCRAELPVTQAPFPQKGQIPAAFSNCMPQ